MDAAFHGMMVCRQKPPVDKQQRDVWLGHDEKRAANAYEAFDPEYLADCMQATERSLQACTNTPNVPCLPASCLRGATSRWLWEGRLETESLGKEGFGWWA